MNYGSSDCPDCRQTTSGNCGKHGNVVVIEGGSTLPLLAERQYCYDRIAALIAERDAARQEAEAAHTERRGLLGLVRAELEGSEHTHTRLLDLAKQRMTALAYLQQERDAALQRAEQAEAALAAVERQTQAEIVRVVEERDAFQHERDLERDETTDLRAALAWVRDQLRQGRTISATDPETPTLIMEADGSVTGNLTVAAQPPAMPPCSVCGRPTGGCCTVTRPTTTFPLTGRPGEAAHLKLKE